MYSSIRRAGAEYTPTRCILDVPLLDLKLKMRTS